MISVTFEHVDGSIKSVAFGPYDWVELRGDELRISPNGEVIAEYNAPNTNIGVGWYIIALGNAYKPFSDIAYNHVIFKSGE